MGQGVIHCQFREDEAVLRLKVSAPKDATVARVQGTPAIHPAVREVVDGEVGGAGEGMGGGRVGVRRLGGDEADGGFRGNEAEEQRWMEGSVEAAEGGIGDEAAESFARGGSAGDVCGGVDPDEDFL